MLRILAYFIILMTFFSCEKKEEKTVNSEKKINYGTSFGFCVGQCNEDIYITENTLIYTHYGNEFNEDTVEATTCQTKTTNEDWSKLETLIEVPDFFKLEKTHGCPDCADGGSEWVEVILTNGTSHKVTFEYGHAPEEMKNYVTFLRDLSDSKEKECKK